MGAVWGGRCPALLARGPAAHEGLEHGLALELELDGVPEEACNLALQVARSCRWDDVGIDICEHNGRFYVLEANMKYGREGFRKAGLDYDRLMESMIENEEI